MKMFKRLTTFMLLGLLAFAVVLNTDTVDAADAPEVGIITEDIPAWAANDLEGIKAAFEGAATDLGAATTAVLPVDLGETRVLLIQEFENGAVFMNETKGEAFVVTDASLITAWKALAEEDKGIILAEAIDDEGELVFLLDNATYRLTNIGITQDPIHVGQIDSTITVPSGFTGEALTTRAKIGFPTAYMFAENYHTTGLGLPVTNILERTHETYKVLNGSGLIEVVFNETTEEDEFTKVERPFYIQEFENGYIIMNHGIDANHGHYGPAPITKTMYDLVVALDNNTDLAATGVPTSREYYVGDKVLQNFEFGFVEVDGTEVTFHFDRAVAPNGTDMPRRVGVAQRYINWNWESYNRTEVMHGLQMLRTTEGFRTQAAMMIDEERVTIEENGDIHDLAFRLGEGITAQIFKKGTGQGIGWGNSFIFASFWYLGGAFEIQPEFNKAYFSNGAEFTHHTRDDLGVPVANGITVRDVTYQEFHKGFIYKKLSDDIPTVIFGDDLVDFMADSETFEEALVANGILVIPGEVVEGTSKFATYSMNNVELTVHYENEENAFTVTGPLYSAWLGDLEGENPTFEMVEAVNGTPIFATEDFLITTTKLFVIDEGVVVEKAGIGALPEGTEKVFGDVDYTAKNKALIMN